MGRTAREPIWNFSKLLSPTRWPEPANRRWSFQTLSLRSQRVLQCLLRLLSAASFERRFVDILLERTSATWDRGRFEHRQWLLSRVALQAASGQPRAPAETSSECVRRLV